MRLAELLVHCSLTPSCLLLSGDSLIVGTMTGQVRLFSIKNKALKASNSCICFASWRWSSRND